MTIEQLEKQINDTAGEWIAVLHHYDLAILLKKPDEENWSIGQVAMHLVSETSFYIEQIEYCFMSDENTMEQMTPDAELMFRQDAFPDVKIVRDAALSQSYPQPISKPGIIKAMEDIRDKLTALLLKIKLGKHKGKTRHQGLGYFTALQWAQFAEMHMRHHIRQKNRIEEALHLMRPGSPNR